MDWYSAIKVLHLLAVLGWMTGIFAVPRALIYWRREWAATGAFGPAGDLTRRLYRFSLGLGVIALASGLWLYWQLGFPAWAGAKLALVLALAAHYGWTGLLVRGALKGEFRRGETWLRVFNEASVLVVIGVLVLVVYRPF